MSALPSRRVVTGMTRDELLKEFLKNHPERVKRLPPQKSPAPLPDEDISDRIPLAEHDGNFQRRKHPGSDQQ